MATITIEIGKVNKGGMRPVSFLVTHNGTKKRIPTELSLAKGEVSADGRRIRDQRKAMAAERLLRRLEDRLYDLSFDILEEGLDAAGIAERLVPRREDPDFFEFADRWVARAGIKGQRNYRSMLNALEGYVGCRRLPFRRITYGFLEGFEDCLRGRDRAVSLYLGGMRHLYREGMRALNTDTVRVIENDPFERYRVPRQRVMKGVRSLSLDEFLRVCEFRGTGRAGLARDCFVLSFCLMGMNSADLYDCRVLRDGVLCYNRVKTRGRRSDGAYMEVRVHPRLSGLMAKYRGGCRVFDFYRRYSSAGDFNRALNIGLKAVGEAVGIEGLQFYQARHTFATLSRNLMRFSKSDVDEALNHVGSLGLADVYIKRDFSIVNDNNARLLGRVFGW